jgi:Tol biopolymer transport system component
MNDPRMDRPQFPPPAGDGVRLNSWKKIAAHFKRDVTTVQRWERREGMPVHRHLHDKQSSVYAFGSELDEWWKTRRHSVSEEGESADEQSRDASALQPSPGSMPGSSGMPEITAPQAKLARPPTKAVKRWSLRLAGFLILGLIFGYGVLKFGILGERAWRNPLANATFTRLTDWPGLEQAAEISRDGRWVAFTADRDGHMDAWITERGSGYFRNLTQGSVRQLLNPSIRTLGFSADGALVTVWTRSADGSHAEDVKLMSASTAAGELHDFLPGVAEVSWSHDGRQIVYHTTAPGDPLFIRNDRGVSRQIYVAPEGVHCHFPLWATDDAYIYFVRGVPRGAWDIWRIQPSGRGLERITFHESSVSHPVLLDSRTLAYLAGDDQESGSWLYALDLGARLPHRISFGLERYKSLAANAAGTRLVATVNESSNSIWQAAFSGGQRLGGHQSAARDPSLVSATGFAARAGPQYLLYVSAHGGRQGVWKMSAGQSRELWGDEHAVIVGAPAVAPDGRHIAFTVADGERTILYVMDSDGRALRALTRSLALHGNPAWAPDGGSIVSAVYHDGQPRLTRIFLDDRPPRLLVSEYSTDPVWSPDGQFLLYSGADTGTTFPLRAIASDGRPYPIPPLILTRGARHVVFRPDSTAIVVLRGEVGHKNLWLVDLRTGAEQQITEFAPDMDIRDFDLARDGEGILFDRVKETSRIALIERGS